MTLKAGALTRVGNRWAAVRGSRLNRHLSKRLKLSLRLSKLIKLSLRLSKHLKLSLRLSKHLR